jgi:hypothetical protein
MTLKVNAACGPTQAALVEDQHNGFSTAPTSSPQALLTLPHTTAVVP